MRRCLHVGALAEVSRKLVDCAELADAPGSGVYGAGASTWYGLS
jgi:hypothetical protein